MRFKTPFPVPVQAVEGRLSDHALVRAVPASGRELLLEVHERWAALEERRLAGGALELAGTVRGAGGEPQLALRPDDGSPTRRYPLALSGSRFSARVPVADLMEGGERTWEPSIGGLRVLLPDEGRQAAWAQSARELALARTRRGEARLIARAVRPLVNEAAWTPDGALELAGEFAAPAGRYELLLIPEVGARAAFALERRDGSFTARVEPARVASLAGELPLAGGPWRLHARPEGGGDPVPVTPAAPLRARLPLVTVLGHKTFRLGLTTDGDAALHVTRDLDDDERGRFNELRLRRSAYVGRRSAAPREAVVYSSFYGRQYSDSPRAIHEELVRRGAPLEHLWVVYDGRCRAPETATAVREGSAEYFEALARSRFVVVNHFFPDWFRRRDGQVCVQAGAGTPLRRLGFDAGAGQRPFRRREHRWAEQVANWQYVLSPGRFATPILRRAYAIEGELLESGLPRVDALLAARGEDVRARLGLAAGARVVLYAPTYRDEAVDRRGRFRLEWRLDVERVRQALGPDDVLLVRKHYEVVDALPEGVRDVSSYPDGTELLAAADVLVTDYSSLMADFAATGRPVLLYAYDAGEEGRGLYLDLEREAPGPLLRSSEELAEALRDVDGAVAGFEERYRAFAARYGELDDGGAAARVVDRLFAPIP
jgi:CDP-glycerol glycerophosphotransferase